ncbi:MAG: hypothetical protein OXT09_22330 [Myxococcales bacterium]|nr:hypothetical protein [Myxococcales bacterium]
MFIRIDLKEDAIAEAGAAAKLIEVCPVKIFAAGADDKSVSIIDDNVDECTLCDLCMEASPKGVKVVKLYEE